MANPNTDSGVELSKKIIGEARTFLEFIQSCASKSLALAVIAWFVPIVTAIITMESDSKFASVLFICGTASAISFVVMDKVVKCCLCKTNHKEESGAPYDGSR